MQYKDHINNPKSFHSLTGFTHSQFQLLLPYFAEAHDDYLSGYEMTGKRRSQCRSFCICRNSPPASVEERLFFIPVYLKNNPLQEYHAACFGMDQKHCNTFVHCLNHILRLSLETMGLVPARTDRELSKCLSGLSQGDSLPVLLHDGTEREIPRPVDYGEQKEKYSGKKKRYTVKNAVIITASCPVLFAGRTVCGRMHDKKIADTIILSLTRAHCIRIPAIRATGRMESIQCNLSGRAEGRNFPGDKISNREVSRVRVRVEHAIGGIKFMRIVKEECRLKANSFVERIFATCAALHNLRIKVAQAARLHLR